MPVTDYGLRFGMSVFETLLATSAGVMFAGEHLARLQSAADTAELPLHSSVDDPGFLESFTRVLCSFANSPGARYGVVARLYATFGDGDTAETGRVFMLAEPATEPPLFLRASVEPVLVQDPFPGLKTGNYWARMAARKRAMAQGEDETLVCVRSGCVAGFASANLLAKIGGQWFTPPFADGARCGVVREWAATLLTLRERTLAIADVTGAEVVAATNSRIGICPVYFGAQRAGASGSSPDEIAGDRDLPELRAQWQMLRDDSTAGRRG